MTLVRSSYGKGRVRVLRLNRDGNRHEVRETNVRVMLEGAFHKAYTEGENSSVIATDSIKNIVNITARENLRLDNEKFGIAIARKFLDRYPQVEQANINILETPWQRLSVGGQMHSHSFTKAGNGSPLARVRARREGIDVDSGVEGFTFMKTTESGWVGYVMDEATTLPETRDRICATSMDASWHYASQPADYSATNAAILQAMLEKFATTYSDGVQDSMYRMGLAALDAVPEVSEISMAMPNKHYLLINLKPFNLDNPNAVFLPTDEPHGQIECTVARG